MNNEGKCNVQALTIGVSVRSDQIRKFMTPAVTPRQLVNCYRCGEQGHYRSECFHWKTRACGHYSVGKCGDENCSFAHGSREIRHVPPSLRFREGRYM